MAFISQGQGSTNGKTEIMKYFQGNRLSTRTVMHGHIIKPPERILDGIALESYLYYVGPSHITPSFYIPNLWFMN